MTIGNAGRGSGGRARQVAALVIAVLITAMGAGCEEPCPPPSVRYGTRCYSPCPSGWCDSTGDVADVPLARPTDASDATPFDGGLADAMDAAPLTCFGSTVVCSGACVDPATDPRHCGGCGRVCSAAAGEVATCTNGTCGTACAPGFERTATGCDPRAPRLIAPMSTATVTRHRPTLRWELPAGLDGATVEICRNRACAASDMVQTFDAMGTSGAPPMPLAHGVWFWRVRGRGRGVTGQRTSPVWQFNVPVRDAATDTSAGVVLDVNGDGYADLAVGAPGARRVYVYYGGASGLSNTAGGVIEGTDVEFGRGLATAGDVNGDGYVDLAVLAGSLSGADRLQVFASGPSGLASTPFFTLPEGAFVRSAGDVNGDGYADVLVRGTTLMTTAVVLGFATTPSLAPARLPSERCTGAGDVNADRRGDIACQVSGDGVGLFLGGVAGVATTPMATIRDSAMGRGYFGIDLARGGDMDGDGHADLLIASASPPTYDDVFVWFGTASLSATLMPASVPHPSDVTRGFSSAVHGGCDLNGDGLFDALIPDLVSVRVFEGRSRMIPNPIATIAGSGDRVVSTGFVGDADRDGYDDFVVFNQYEPDPPLVFYRGRSGASSFTGRLLTPGADRSVGFGASLAFAE